MCCLVVTTNVISGVSTVPLTLRTALGVILKTLLIIIRVIIDTYCYFDMQKYTTAMSNRDIEILLSNHFL